MENAFFTAVGRNYENYDVRNLLRITTQSVPASAATTLPLKSGYESIRIHTVPMVSCLTGLTLTYQTLHGATIILGPRHTILTGLGAPYRYTRDLA